MRKYGEAPTVLCYKVLYQNSKEGTWASQPPKLFAFDSSPRTVRILVFAPLVLGKHKGLTVALTASRDDNFSEVLAQNCSSTLVETLEGIPHHLTQVMEMAEAAVSTWPSLIAIDSA